MASKTLVTGGCGFIGRAVTDELLRNGYEVRVLDSLVPQVHGEEPPERCGVNENPPPRAAEGGGVS